MGDDKGKSGEGAVMIQLTRPIVLGFEFQLDSLGTLIYLTRSIDNSELQKIAY